MCMVQMATNSQVSLGSQLRNKALADGVPSGLFDKIAQDNRNRSDRTWVNDAFVKGLSGGGSSQKSATRKVAKKSTTVTRKTPTTATKGAVKKRSSMMTRSRGTEATANIKRKTLLGA